MNQNPSAVKKIRVSLFATCLVDQIMPRVGIASVKLLEQFGCEVLFNPEQTCCGQPAFNSGFRHEARELALRFVDQFENSDYVVIPSGSCASMIRVFYGELLPQDSLALLKYEKLKPNIYELTEFLVKVLQVEKLPSVAPGRVAYHDSCHLLRELRVHREPRRLLNAMRHCEQTPLKDEDKCCGFGGSFSMKFPELSEAIADDKINNIRESGADVVTACDAGCLLHIEGRMKRLGVTAKTLHIAELLAGFSPQSVAENGGAS